MSSRSKERKALVVSSSSYQTLIPSRGPHPPDLICHLPRALSANTITLGGVGHQSVNVGGDTFQFIGSSLIPLRSPTSPGDLGMAADFPWSPRRLGQGPGEACSLGRYGRCPGCPPSSVSLNCHPHSPPPPPGRKALGDLAQTPGLAALQCGWPRSPPPWGGSAA